jgi:cation:H+ antiporter
MGSCPVSTAFFTGAGLLWLLFTIKIARLAERQGSDSLTREQLAELPREGSLPVALLWLGVAMIVMPMATRMVVDNATVLANYFAISELTVGLTVVAIGTSLPELATAIAGARKGKMTSPSAISSALIFLILRWCWAYRR